MIEFLKKKQNSEDTNTITEEEVIELVSSSFKDKFDNLYESKDKLSNDLLDVEKKLSNDILVEKNELSNSLLDVKNELVNYLNNNLLDIKNDIDNKYLTINDKIISTEINTSNNLGSLNNLNNLYLELSNKLSNFEKEIKQSLDKINSRKEETKITLNEFNVITLKASVLPYNPDEGAIIRDIKDNKVKIYLNNSWKIIA